MKTKPLYVYASIYEYIPRSENVNDKEGHIVKMPRYNNLEVLENKEFIQTIKYERTLLSEDVDENEVDDLQTAVAELMTGKLKYNKGSGTIIFRANKFEEIFPLYNILLYDVDYCHMCGLSDIEYGQASVGGKLVNIAMVYVDSESG